MAGFGENRGDPAAAMQDLSGLEARERAQVEALTKLQLSNAKLLAQERAKHLDDLAAYSKQKAAEVLSFLDDEIMKHGESAIDSLAEHLLTKLQDASSSFQFTGSSGGSDAAKPEKSGATASSADNDTASTISSDKITIFTDSTIIDAKSAQIAVTNPIISGLAFDEGLAGTSESDKASAAIFTQELVKAVTSDAGSGSAGSVKATASEKDVPTSSTSEVAAGTKKSEALTGLTDSGGAEALNANLQAMREQSQAKADEKARQALIDNATLSAELDEHMVHAAQVRREHRLHTIRLANSEELAARVAEIKSPAIAEAETLLEAGEASKGVAEQLQRINDLQAGGKALTDQLDASLEETGGLEAVLKQQADVMLKQKLQLEQDLLQSGFTIAEIQASRDAELQKQRLADIEARKEAELAALSAATDMDEIERKKKEKEIKDKAARDKKQLKDAVAMRDKLEKESNAKRLKEAQDVFAATYKNPAAILGIGKQNKEAQEEATRQLRAKGFSDEAITRAQNSAKANAAIAAIADFAEQLASQGASIAKNQTTIDTRLQGTKVLDKMMGSYWKQMDWNIGKAVGVSPFIRNEDVVNDLQTLVKKGIAFNVDQRAFLQTVSEKIADTFDAADATLVKLVRIQQADTTAARLGMESALTSFLNSMYATSEYMTDAAASIRGHIYEASALTGATAATELEYHTQKWLGSLYSVGFTQADSVAAAFGKLAAGDVSGITDGGVGNLLVMAANNAGLSIGDLLAKGIGAKEANSLFKAMVDYLAKIYNESKDSRVVSQQFANVFGLSASDLKAAAGLKVSADAIYKQNLDYGGMMKQLSSMADTMVLRTSMGEMLQNALDNFTYSMSAAMGNDPILFATYKVASMVDSLAGGIDLPFVNVMGFGLDLNTSVAELMKVAAVSGSALAGIGKLVASLGSAGGFSGSGMLKSMGVDLSGSSVSMLTRGTTAGLLSTSGTAVSSSGYVGNESSSDVQNKTVSDASESPNNQMAEAKEESADVTTKQIDDHIVQIYDLLLEVCGGTRALTVTVGTAGAWN